MNIVYVLRDSSGNFYKGMTQDLSRRLNEHKSGHAKSTKHLQDLEVVYTEEYLDRQTARKREKYLKSAAGRRFLQKILGP